MKDSRLSGRRTRREFLTDAVRLGLGAAAFGLLDPGATVSALAQGNGPERVTVLVDDLVEATPADFARGQARGVTVASEAGHGVLRGARGAQFTSGVISLPFAATHVGVHWVLRDSPVEAVTAEVRTSLDGRTWSDWQPLAIEAVSDLPSEQEVFAALAAGKRGRYAQYLLHFQSDQTATVDRVTVTALNSVDGPRQPAPTGAPLSTTLSAGPVTIGVITREGWNCDESLRFRRKTELWPEMYVPAKKFVLHHTATTNDYTDPTAEIRSIYTYHARTLGWGEIGYNSIIDRAGNIYEGRHGRGEGANREIMSADVVAGHVYSHNYGSTGAAALGNYQDGQPPSAMLASIDRVAAFECTRHYIDPNGVSDFLRSDDVWHGQMHNISGHYESYATECPGTYLINYLSDLRSHVASRLAGSPPPGLAGPATGPNTAALSAPAALSFSWPSTGGPYSWCLEGWYKPSNSYDISYLQGYDAGGDYNDPLAREQVWTSANGTSKDFSNLAAGHYTMHLRADSGRYEANLTYLVTGSTTTKRGRK